MLEVILKNCQWKAYPSKTHDEEAAYNIDITTIRDDKDKYEVNKKRSDYVGRLISHRTENASNYKLLKSTQKTQNTDEIIYAIKTHIEREKRIDSLSINVAFRAINYTMGEK